MSDVSNDAKETPDAVEQSAGRGGLPWFSNKEWLLLLTALAVAIGITTAAAFNADHGSAAATPAPANVAVVATSTAPSTPTTATTAAVQPAATASVATTGSTTAATAVAVTTAGTTTKSSTTVATTAKPKTTTKTTVAKSTSTAAASPVTVGFTVGSEVNFGSYGGAPLRWRVLDIDSTSVLLLSKYVVSSGAFQSNWEGTNASAYSSSEIRSNLRGTFTSQAFNTTETAALLPHVGGTTAGDRVFLLSAAEVQHYFPKAADRRAAPSAAAGNGATGFDSEPLTLTGPYASWWLPDPAADEFSAQVVLPNGALGSQLVYYADLGVRPAIRVERDKIGFTISAGN